MTCDNYNAMPDLIYGISFAIMSSLGISAYALYCTVILRNRSTFPNIFFTFTVSLAIIDSLVMVNLLVFDLSRAFGFRNDLQESIQGNLALVLHYGVAAHVAAIGFTRFIAIQHRHAYKAVFDTKHSVFFIAVGPCAGVATSILLNRCACRIVYQRSFWIVDCNIAISCSFFALFYQITVTVMGSLVVVLLYSRTIIGYCKQKRLEKLRAEQYGPYQLNAKRKAAHSRRRKESHLLFNFIAISTVMFVYTIWFWVCMGLSDNKWAMLLLHFLCIAMNPFFYVAFCTEVRMKLSELFCFDKWLFPNKQRCRSVIVNKLPDQMPEGPQISV